MEMEQPTTSQALRINTHLVICVRRSAADPLIRPTIMAHYSNVPLSRRKWEAINNGYAFVLWGNMAGMEACNATSTTDCLAYQALRRSGKLAVHATH